MKKINDNKRAYVALIADFGGADAFNHAMTLYTDSEESEIYELLDEMTSNGDSQVWLLDLNRVKRLRSLIEASIVQATKQAENQIDDVVDVEFNAEKTFVCDKCGSVKLLGTDCAVAQSSEKNLK